jgi:hypothetical protein
MPAWPAPWGRAPGNSKATTLKAKAAPVPIAISENMFKLRFFTDASARTKNGHPAHSTTGVARTIWIQFEVDGFRYWCRSSR